MTLQELYNQYITPPIDNNQCNSDIWALLHILKDYCTGYEHITEVGTRRGISTVALMMAKPKKLVCYDIGRYSEIDTLEEIAKEEGIDFVYKQQDILKSEIEETDVYFCDSFHQNNFVRKELELHAKKVNHLLIFHDCETYGYGNGEGWYNGVNDIVLDGKGIMYAIDDFAKENPHWVQVFKTAENNGMLIFRNNKNPFPYEAVELSKEASELFKRRTI